MTQNEQEATATASTKPKRNRTRIFKEGDLVTLECGGLYYMHGEVQGNWKMEVIEYTTMFEWPHPDVFYCKLVLARNMGVELVKRPKTSAERLQHRLMVP